MKILMILARGMFFAGFLSLCAASDSAAFHNGGAGACEGCHTMHNTSEGVPIGQAHPYLLREQDPSSTCLYCHQHAGDIGPTKFHISTPDNELLQGMAPKQLTPGGDFGWLKKTYSWTPGAGLLPLSSAGERHGHNITAADFLYDADSTYTIAPGGAYPSARFSCTSCHDPHGQYRRNVDGTITSTGKPIADSGSYASSPDPDASKAVGVYRLLAGKNYQPKSLAGNFAFFYDPPAAVAPGANTGASNRAEDTTQTRVAYGAGMSEWCRNCHPDMHTTTYPGRANLVHAAGNTAKLGVVKASNYNAYIKTGDLSGTVAASFLSLAPFEEGTADYVVLKAHAKTDDTYLAGPDNTNAEVMCLSCHRAHASGWDGITRWNTKTDYIEYNGFYAQEGQVYQPYGQGRTEAEARRAYYEKPANKFALNQDALCNKCHIGVYP